MLNELRVRDLHAFYGESHILFGVDMFVRPNEIVGLLGRNGAGRSTLARAVMGLVKAEGQVSLGDASIADLSPHQIARRGLGYVPETRDVFPDLTVQENLTLGQQRRGRANRWSVDEFFDRFPNLAARRSVPAGALSGGEQQMLTLCRTLLGDPDIVLVDEPTEGLAPKLVDDIRALLVDARARGVGILLIEQKLSIALDVCDRLYVIGAGRIVFDGRPDEFAAAQAMQREWLGIG